MASLKPVLLIILDGWGVAPAGRGNAISLAATSTFDKILTSYPVMNLQAGGEAVGLSWGEMGNSEVGHLNLGAGRIVYQDLPRITKSIVDASFFKNRALKEASTQVKKHKSSLHLFGLVSSGGIHSFNEHLYALLEFCKQEKLTEVFVHAFLDGRDTPRSSGYNFIDKLQKKISELKLGKIATLSGRFYAMDRDNHWDRIEKAYLAIAEGESRLESANPLEAIKSSYQKEIYDEEFIPTVIVEGGKPVAQVNDNDAIIYFNFRSDRARELTKAFILPGFDKFKKKKVVNNLLFVTMTEYEKDLPVVVAFQPEKVKTPIAKVIADLGMKQLHLAETEKYAHVTFFFNGGIENPFSGEDRILVPSPSVPFYDQKPAMAARELKDRVIEAIKEKKYQFIVMNFANADMVGHSGNLQATIKAVETIDKCLGEILKAALAADNIVVITGDHGNAEEMVNLQTGEIDKEHTTNPVPLMIVGKEWEGKLLKHQKQAGDDLSRVLPAGVLSDVAPTILNLMGISKPAEMTGQNLL